jgi:putative oxygen-independent coproporphyrinogen III oxidase
MTPQGVIMERDSTLGIYIHVPFCHHRCPYCDFYIEELRDRPARIRLEFTNLINQEGTLRLQSHSLQNRELATIYFGGGTPSTLQPEAIKELLDQTKLSFSRISEDLEVTLEANPENLTEKRCEKWAQTGVNRLSVGIQSFFPEDLKLLERPHSPDLAKQAVQNAKKAGIKNISTDLMFALPNQSLQHWQENLKQAISLEPQHLSFYGLTYHENTRFQQWLDAGNLKEIDEEIQAEMYLWGSYFLKQHGFEHYEISNFARPGFRSRHNQRYWNRQDVLALGPGAHGNLAALRYANTENLDLWKASLLEGSLNQGSEETLCDHSRKQERLFTALRRSEGISQSQDPDLFSLCREWAKNLPSEAQSWVVLNEKRFSLTIEGWLRSDGIIQQIIKVMDK